MQRKKRKVILIFGKTGSGKSFLTRKLLSRYDRAIIFDPKEEYSGFTVRSFEEFIAYFELDTHETFNVVCRFQRFSDYDKAADACFTLGNLVLVLEECELFLSSYDVDSEDPLNQVISFGRHERISVIAIGRRPSEIPIRIRAQCSTIVTFKQTEPTDLQALERWGFSRGAVEALSFDAHEYLIEMEPLP